MITTGKQLAKTDKLVERVEKAGQPTITRYDYDPCNITFNSEGKKIGSLDWKNGKEIIFTGNATEAAKMFFKELGYLFEGAIKKAREEAHK